MLTEEKIRSLTPGKKMSDKSPKGQPTLYIKANKTGARDFYIRYRTNKKYREKKIGRHFRSSPNNDGITLKKAREITKTYPIEELIKPRNRVIKQKEETSSGDTFGDLLSEYVLNLKSKKKRSANSVENSINLHIKKPHPKLIGMKASDIESRHIQEILALMVKKDLKREVNKVRSYIHAAFEYAARFDYDPRTLGTNKQLFNIKNNPATLIPVIREFENAKERHLSNTELKLYWQKLNELSPLMEKCLKIQLLLAGQRFTQLTDLVWKDYDEEYKIITLYDTKGRNSKKQPHILPLTEKVFNIFQELKAWNYEYKWPFTIKGTSQISVQDGSAAVARISEQLSASHNLEPFGLRDIRRTCETMLSRLRVDKETRAHLLSHGRSVGVQSIHYDKYDFFDEKMDALNLWDRHLDRIFSVNDSL